MPKLGKLEVAFTPGSPDTQQPLRLVTISHCGHFRLLTRGIDDRFHGRYSFFIFLIESSSD